MHIEPDHDNEEAEETNRQKFDLAEEQMDSNEDQSDNIVD